MALRSLYSELNIRIPVPVRGAILAAALLFGLSDLDAQDASSVGGIWTGSVTTPGGVLGIEFNLKRGASWSGTYSIPMQGVSDFALEAISVDLPTVSFKLGGGIPGNPTFNLTLSDDGSKLEGELSQAGGRFPAVFDKQGKSGSVSTGTTTLTLEEKLAEIRIYLEENLHDWNIPGMAVAVVRSDTVLLSEGFGVRSIDGSKKVTPKTLFAIGSTTKAFTATVIGSLVDEGLLDLDEPVRTYLPDFQLQDEYATAHITLRDLLSHRSGLPRHDLLWYDSKFTRQELYDRLRYLEPTAELRQKWQYQNLMFMTAGLVAERLTGKTWEELVRERIFKPLGMKDAVFSVDDMEKSADHAVPHSKNSEKKIETIEPRNLDAIGPAGSIDAGVAEMATWVRLNLNGGELNGTRVLSAEVLREIQSPQAVMSDMPTINGGIFSLYGMGWMLTAYQGHKLVHHGGGIDGFITEVALLPEDDLGVVVLTNLPTPLPERAALDIIDIMLDLPRKNHGKAALAQNAIAETNMEQLRDSGEKNNVDRIEGTSPSYPDAEYDGRYSHPAYGVMNIFHDEKGMGAIHQGDTVRMGHYHYDVFQVLDNEGEGTTFLISFQPDSRGGVAALTMPLEAALEHPIRFEKLPSQRMTDPNFLKTFAGTYELMSREAEIAVKGSALTVSLPGQPLYTLLPQREVGGLFAEFTIEGLNGFRVRFELENGRSERAVFIQPNGTFIGKRK